MKKLVSLFTVCLFALTALFTAACNSLPEGASAPKLNIESLSLSNQDKEPVFIISYTLKHTSPEPLPILGISADVFIRDEKVATLQQEYKNKTLEPNKLERFELVVPANLMGSAGVDSLANNTLIMLQGSCALTVSVTDDSDLNAFNPVSSYQGLVKVVKPGQEQTVTIAPPHDEPMPPVEPKVAAEVQTVEELPTAQQTAPADAPPAAEQAQPATDAQVAAPAASESQAQPATQAQPAQSAAQQEPAPAPQGALEQPAAPVQQPAAQQVVAEPQNAEVAAPAPAAQPAAKQ